MPTSPCPDALKLKTDIFWIALLIYFPTRKYLRLTIIVSFIIEVENVS